MKRVIIGLFVAFVCAVICKLLGLTFWPSLGITAVITILTLMLWDRESWFL